MRLDDTVRIFVKSINKKLIYYIYEAIFILDIAVTLLNILVRSSLNVFDISLINILPLIFLVFRLLFLKGGLIFNLTCKVV